MNTSFNAFWENCVPSLPPKGTVAASKDRPFGTGVKIEKALIVQSTPVIQCCGASYIYNFTLEPELIEDDIPKLIKRALVSHQGMLCAWINHSQVKIGIGSLLTKYGFVEVFKTVNPAHGERTVIHLYVLDLTHKASQQK